VQELNEKVRDFEQREARATLAMQLAARKVLWENDQLRALLSAKGVTSTEVSEYLEQRRLVIQSSASTTSMSKPGQTTSHVATSPSAKDSKAAGITMSCENAASIIAGMRGHSDDDAAVRKELGCASGQTCEVQNVRVLQVMEME
jgi:hypothetical protein